MKRILALLTAIMLLIGSCAFAEEGLTARDINTADAFAFSVKRIKANRSPAEYKDYYVQQGCCTDGTYAYCIVENQVISRCAIWKINLEDGEMVKSRYGLEIDHGNDIAYHPGLNQLIAVHNKPNYTYISFIDPETLEVVSTRELPYKIFSIGYEASRDQYVIGISGTYHFVVLDGDFNTLAYYEGVETGFTKQNVDVDENYIYFTQWKGGNKGNLVMVYDWKGNFVTQIRVKSYVEIESLLHAGDDWYIAFYDSVNKGPDFCKAELEYDSKKVYQSTLGK